MPVLLKAAGAALFAVGAIGIVVPVLPTTIFWILAVLCLVRAGDPRAARILEHPRFGPGIRLFLEHGAMTRPAKLASLGGMGLGAVLLMPVAPALPAAAASGWAVLILSALCVATRPEPAPAAVRAGATASPPAPALPRR
ncbi:YbaN family protein [Azospirillum halopraeferens]|uniref:YbaN family protein n=1 Tax=Azospirillum halopraeferens TaxID=34010 RepID=UPI00041CD21C|nr:YbaN family protein [Azospirillum halopraeferens]